MISREFTTLAWYVELRAAGLRGQAPHDRVHVARDLRVAQDRHLPLDLGRGLAAGLHVLLHGEQVDRGGRGRGDEAHREHGGAGAADRESLDHGVSPLQNDERRW